MTFIFWLISLLPLRVLHAIGGALGLLVARLPGRYGQRLTENFRHAYPDVTDAMLDEAARATGRLIVEMPYFWSRKSLDAKLYNFDDSLWPTLNRLQMQANGIIILTPHLGCFEVLPQSHAVHRPVTALYKPPHQPWLREFIEKMRSRPGVSMAPATPRGVRMLVKALRRGEAIGILPDQVPSAGEGTWAPFFGKPAYSMTLVHRLHRLTNAPVVMMFAERLPKGGGYVGHMRLVGCGGVLAAEVEAAAAQINRAVEELISMAPTQYLWGYNRYKQPTGAPPPPDLTSQPQAATHDTIQ